MSKKYKAELFSWEENILKKTEHFFEVLNEAIAYCEEAIADSGKVIDDDGNVHHVVHHQHHHHHQYA